MRTFEHSCNFALLIQKFITSDLDRYKKVSQYGHRSGSIFTVGNIVRKENKLSGYDSSVYNHHQNGEGNEEKVNRRFFSARIRGNKSNYHALDLNHKE